MKKKWFGNLSISKKIIFVFTPLVLVPLILLVYVATAVSSDAIIDNTRKSEMDSATLIIEKIDSILRNVDNCANFIVFALNRIPSSDPIPSDEFEIVERNKTIRTYLDIGAAMFPEIESVTYVDVGGDKLLSTSPVIERALPSSLSQAYNEIDQVPYGSDKWFPMNHKSFLSEESAGAMLVLGKKIVNIENGEMVGYVFVELAENEISSVFKNIGATPNGMYAVLDQSGIVISTDRKANLFKPLSQSPATQGSALSFIDSHNQLITTSPIHQMNWILYRQTPLHELTQDNLTTTRYFLIIGILCFAFTLLGTSILAKYISLPILRLSKHMRHNVEGKIEAYPTGATTDEVGILSFSFNVMVGRIDELMKGIKVEQRKKREFELALLHSQIKPHFLYNTLETIYVLADLGETKQLKEAIKSVSGFYRHALNSGKEIISIGEELSIIRHYLNIQRIRYSDILNFTIKMDEEILLFNIPKLTLQPLVENSIYHGIKGKDSLGIIDITGEVENSILYIYIRDDGVGMTPERLHDLQKNSDIPWNSFGLRSVNERIKLYYGPEYGLSIQSEFGSGTQVTVRIPAHLKGE